jgi:hypothetical protein
MPQQPLFGQQKETGCFLLRSGGGGIMLGFNLTPVLAGDFSRKKLKQYQL